MIDAVPSFCLKGALGLLTQVPSVAVTRMSRGSPQTRLLRVQLGVELVQVRFCPVPTAIRE